MSLGTISVFYFPLIFLEKGNLGKTSITGNLSGRIFVFVFILAILNYLGRDYLDITEEQYKAEIDQMDKYPNDKSIKVINGNVFVKLE